MKRKKKWTLQSTKAKDAIQKLVTNPEFRREIEALRIKWGVDFDNPKREQNLKKTAPARWKYSEARDMESYDISINLQSRTPCINDLLGVLKKYNLDSVYWLSFVWRYFKDGNVEPIEMYADTIPLVRLQSARGESVGIKIVIELGASTTLKDVKEAWHQVEELRKKMGWKRPKFKLWKNFERDSKIYALCQQGKNTDEISSTMLKEGFDLDYGNIKKIISTYRKRLGLPKGGKLQTSSIKQERVTKKRLR